MDTTDTKSGEMQMSTAQGPKKSLGSKLLSFFLSCMPWAIVATLLWAGIFVKPTPDVQVVIPPAIEDRDKIYGIAALTSETLWIVGNYGKILRSEDAGQTWSGQDSTTEKHLQDISAWDSDHAVAVGNGGIVLVTENGGKTWDEIDVPRSEIANKLIRVHTYADGEAWAVGELGMILHSVDYGRTWTRMREEEDVIMNDLIKLDDGKIFVVGEYGRIFRSEDNGQTWQDDYTDSPSSLTAIDFRSPQHGVIVGLDGVILATEDSGETWTMISSDISGNTEHLMDVQWSEQINKWVTVGNKSRWVRFSGDLTEFSASNLSPIDLSSHTELAVLDNGVIAVGANVCTVDYEGNKYTTLGN
ncbi:MAG: glycosyl hydrolase [Gammaproteobacteria bacterium]|nr:MAG: glycosyl hydrolase [Gammaproteobacteria bacterium]